MKRFWRPRFTLAALLATVGFSAVFLSLYQEYAQEQRLLRRLSLPSQELSVFFNTKLGDPNALDTSKGYILTKWDGPEVLEKPMRLVGCPWFDRAVNISIYDDGNVAIEDLRQLRDLDQFRLLTIIDPKKPREDYRNLRNHLSTVSFDCVDMRPPDAPEIRGTKE